MKRTPSSKAVKYQDTVCYLPVINETHNGKTTRIVLPGDPLVDRTTAEKYAQIEINRRNGTLK